ncbi:hypothetical protein KF7_0925 [Lactococcus lactis subsp. lactis]|nr:hypothetical protein KF7_0925 [Lactococcus lactis subsp. lactis]
MTSSESAFSDFPMQNLLLVNVFCFLIIQHYTPNQKLW